MEKLNKFNFADLAEEAIKSLQYTNRKGKTEIKVSNSQIRKLLAMVNGLYNNARTNKGEILDEDSISDIQYVRMKFAYEAGRDNNNGVKEFIKRTNLMEYIKGIKDSKSELLLFCKYMESLVAYHKFYGGKK